MTPTRRRYLAAAEVVVGLLARPEVATTWDGASLLPAFGVGDLAGHLARSILQVEWFLDAAEPAPSAGHVMATEYYGALEGVDDVESPLNVGVRERGHEVAVDGHAELARRTRACLRRLVDRLATEPSSRLVTARGRALTLDEYLRTRLVEIAVHVEDLALSVGRNIPELPDDVLADAVDVLLGAARYRHGERAVLRALTRRERDDISALRVL